MKKNLFLMLGLGAMLLTSCDQDIVNEIYLPGGGGSVVVTDSMLFFEYAPRLAKIYTAPMVCHT